MTKEEAKKFGLHLLQGIMERNESYPIYANNVKQAIDALSETSGSSEIPNDLEEAAIKYQESVPVDTTIHYCGADEDVYFANRLVDAVSFGAKWQYQKDRGKFAQIKAKTWCEGFDACKEQMVKEAVEGEVSAVILHKHGDEVHYAITYPEGESPHSITDKVRIIIVKED